MHDGDVDNIVNISQSRFAHEKGFDELEEQGRSSAETHIICQSVIQIVPVIDCDCTHAPETLS